jgi:hypothetical protein
LTTAFAIVVGMIVAAIFWLIKQRPRRAEGRVAGGTQSAVLHRQREPRSD